MTAELHWVDALPEADLWEGDLADAECADEPILLVHLLGGEIRAYQGLCPHQEVALVDGKWDEETGVLLCGGHSWEFDLSSGEGINPAGCRLFRYPVRVADGRIEVGIPQDGASHYNRASSAREGRP
jgi:toluene monooxygenase system ferredoxin subunit